MHLKKCVGTALSSAKRLLQLRLPQSGGRESRAGSGWLKRALTTGRGQRQLAPRATLIRDVSTSFAMQDFFDNFFFLRQTVAAERLSRDSLQTRVTVDSSSADAKEPSGLMKTDSFIDIQFQSGESATTTR